MGWNDVDLRQVNPNIDPISEGKHVFVLSSAKKSPRDPEEINCRAIVRDGEYSGRSIFFSYPDPDRFAWSPKALKRFESVLGVECLEGEDKVEWLNRAAGTPFKASVKHDKYVPEGSDRETIKEKLLTFTVEVAD